MSSEKSSLEEGARLAGGWRAVRLASSNEGRSKMMGRGGVCVAASRFDGGLGWGGGRRKDREETDGWGGSGWWRRSTGSCGESEVTIDRCGRKEDGRRRTNRWMGSLNRRRW